MQTCTFQRRLRSVFTGGIKNLTNNRTATTRWSNCSDAQAQCSEFSLCRHCIFVNFVVERTTNSDKANADNIVSSVRLTSVYVCLFLYSYVPRLTVMKKQDLRQLWFVPISTCKLNDACPLRQSWTNLKHEPRHDKTNNVAMRPAKIQISLGIRPVRSESSLSAWRKLESLATHLAHSEDSDQTGRMPELRLRWAHMPFCWFCHEVAQIWNILILLKWHQEILGQMFAKCWSIVQSVD